MTNTGITLHKHTEQKQQIAYYTPAQLYSLCLHILLNVHHTKQIKYHLYKLQGSSHLKSLTFLKIAQSAFFLKD